MWVSELNIIMFSTRVHEEHQDDVTVDPSIANED